VAPEPAYSAGDLEVSEDPHIADDLEKVVVRLDDCGLIVRATRDG
jgi:hypothetical protein